MTTMIKKIICMILGHHVVFGLFENDRAITNKGCARCGRMFLTLKTHYKMYRNWPIPGATKEEWERACDDYTEQKRKEFKQFGEVWNGAKAKYM